MINPFTHRKILKKGRPGRAEIVAMSNRDGGATSQNVAMTLHVYVEGMAPYEVEDQWMVHHTVALGFGMQLPVKVDQENPQKVAIDWGAAKDEQASEKAARRATLAAVEVDERAVYVPGAVRLLGLNGIAPRMIDRLLRRLRGPSAAPRR